MERLQKIEVVNGGEMRVQFVILLMRMFFVLCTEKLSVLLVIHSNLTHNQIHKSSTTIVLVAKLLEPGHLNLCIVKNGKWSGVNLKCDM